MTSPNSLISWIGDLDFRMATAVVSDDADRPKDAPVLNSIEWLLGRGELGRVLLLHDGNKTPRDEPTITWLVEHVVSMVQMATGPNVSVETVNLSPLGDAKHSYEAMLDRISPIVESALEDGGDVYMNGSSGRPIKHGAFMLLAATSARLHLLDCRTKDRVGEMIVPDRVRADIGRSVRRSTVRRYVGGKPQDEAAAEFHDILGKSPALVLARNDASRYSTIGDESILLLGETGTGKTMFAEAIHKASSRRDHPFRAINCAAIPKELAESELFGHVKHAATGIKSARDGMFRSADKGTVFLDEVGDLNLDLQTKLLKVLDDGMVRPVGADATFPVNVRIIAATHRDLLQMVAAGTFRQDLWYRLAVCPIRIPPLRERGDDLDQITETRWNEIIEKLPGADAKSLSAGAKMALRQHDWPGNVRELEATLTRLALTCRTKIVGKEDVIEAIHPAPTAGADGILDRPFTEDQPIRLKSILSEVVGHYMIRAYEQSGGNKTKAARMLRLTEKRGGNTKFIDWVKQYDVRTLKKKLGIKDG